MLIIGKVDLSRGRVSVPAQGKRLRLNAFLTLCTLSYCTLFLLCCGARTGAEHFAGTAVFVRTLASGKYIHTGINCCKKNQIFI
jgi:hypothetical protein